MVTNTDEPGVQQKVASMRPDAGVVDLAWNQDRRRAALMHALNAPGERAAEPKRHRGRRASGWISVGIGVAAVSTAAVLLVPTLLPPAAVPATPAGNPSASPTQATATQPNKDLAQVTVDATGWKTFSSPEYPITFRYPADWKVSFARFSAQTAKAEQLTAAGIVDGCAVDGCAVYVSPPGQDVEGGHSIVLMRNGFQGFENSGDYAGGKVLAAVPDLKVWDSPDAASASTAAIVTQSDAGFCTSGCSAAPEFGPPYEYMLSTSGLAQQLAVGDANPSGVRPEASFSFGTNWGVKDDEAKTVATILASSRQNADFNPTQPQRDSSGRYTFWVNDSMAKPVVGGDVGTWKALDVPDGNVSVSIPPSWKVVDHHDGIIWLKAPSGYIIDVLTNGEAAMGCVVISNWNPSEKLGEVQGVSAQDADGVSRPLEIWWQNATWLPVQVQLTLVRQSTQSRLCSQSAIDYGGKHPVYVGSADNSANPTSGELDQAVAILASLKRTS